MDSYDGSCEIVEADAEFGVQHSRGPYEPQRGLDAVGREKKPPLSKMGYRNSLENDINTLFEAISLKSSSKGIDLSDQPGTSINLMKKSALKKPITVGMPQSPRVGTAEQVSLKQALRDLCISKASEMASMKRLSKSSGSPGYSEAGRIKSLYNSVVIEASRKSDIPQYEGKGRISGISMTPDERTSHSTSKLDRQLPNLHIMSSGRSTFSSSGVTEQETVRVAETTLKEAGVSTSKEIGSRELTVGTLEECEEVVSHGGCLNASESKKPSPVSPKLPKKQSATRLVRKARLQSMTSSTSNNGNKVSKVTRNVPRVAKHVLRNKHTIKRKTKKELASTANTPDAADEVNVSMDPSSNQLVCQRCQCALNHTSNESKQEFEVSPPSASGNAEVRSTEANPVVGGINLSANNSSRNRTAVLKAKENPKTKQKGKFSQSSSSLGDSSSTSLSDDSNVSGSSCGNKPHMSKDVRWEAIHQIKIHYGALSLSHFNLLKKLGCGDIGTVYLAELIAANCLFAIKVMDNEFLARRKKTPRAQTEREILRMLDHPFLPTLYTQFTSDNLSCLVMEYCPGGDLHVLRQKQPGRCFHEPAARFYVAEVLLALEYLHMLGVIYRDLKPENILVREDGHIMLTDFDLSLRCNVNPTLLQSSSTLDPARISGPCRGSSCIDPFCIEPTCQMSCFSPRFFPAASRTRKLKADLAARVRSLPQLVAEPTEARSNSFVGTHEYLAPEIIKGEGHGAAVDWWTFGVLLYELLYGRTPFKGPGNEETLANVVLQSLKFPDSPLVSFQARDLIKLLLVKEPENRLGTQRGAAEIKQHPFFDGLNWALIRCAVPPELPDLYEYGVPSMASPGTASQYLDCKATGEQLEFELF